MDVNIGKLDIVIVILYIILTFYIGWRVSKNVKSDEDFSVAGRNVGVFTLVSTICATNFSSWSIVGKPGLVYNIGISQVWIALNAMALVLGAVIFIPIYRKLKYVTMSEIFEDRYNGKLRKTVSIIWIISDTLNRYGVTIYAASIIIGLMFGVNLHTTILVISLITLVFTIMGGLTSVVVTDAIQFVVMFLGLFIGGYFIFSDLGGWSGVASSTPDKVMELVPGIDSAGGWPWIMAMTMLGFPYFVTSQFVMQRGLGAKSINIAKWGLLFAGIVTIPIAILEVLPGLAAHSILPESLVNSVNPDMVGPLVYIKLLPSGLLGIFFAAVISAGISTADSALTSSSSLIVEDFYKKANPNKKNTEYLKTSRIVAVILAIVGTVWALFIERLGAVNAILNVIAITDMPIFVIICLGLLWKKMKTYPAIISLVVGTISGVVVSLLKVGGIQGLAVTTATSTFVTLILAVVLSNAWKQDSKEESKVKYFFEKISN